MRRNQLNRFSHRVINAIEGKQGARIISHGGIYLLGVGNQGGFSEGTASPPRPVGKQGLGGERKEDTCRRRDPRGKKELGTLEDFSLCSCSV